MSSLFGKKLPGDDAILGKVIKFMEKQGYEVVGAHEAMPSIIGGKGQDCW